MSTRHQVTAGFLPLLDSALLVIAREKGFAEEEGVALSLVRESSWANIRDRLAVGHQDAVHRTRRLRHSRQRHFAGRSMVLAFSACSKTGPSERQEHR